MSATLGNGQTLTQGNYLASPNNSYFAVMQSDGNFVLYTSRDWRPVNAVWASNTYGRGIGPYRVTMQDDGNLVVYDSRNTALWASNTYRKGANPHRLIMQSDRNLVIYDGNNSPTWASNTNI